MNQYKPIHRKKFQSKPQNNNHKSSHENSQQVNFGGGDLGVIGANGAEARGISCGVPETGDEVEGKNSEGRVVAEGGGGQNASGSRDTTAPDLLGQEAGESGKMGGLVEYI